MTALWRALFLVAGGAVFATGAIAQSRPAAPVMPAKPGLNDPKVNADAAALQDFRTRLGRYLTLRSDLAKNLKPLTTAPDAAQLSARQEALTAAIKAARTTAKRGDLIPPLVAQLIARTARNDFKRRNPTAKMGLFEDVPAAGGASLINRIYPASEALSTMPPLLLANLPELPDNLQYRFVGRDVAILDGDVQIVIDYIPRVLPVH